MFIACPAAPMRLRNNWLALKTTCLCFPDKRPLAIVQLPALWNEAAVKEPQKTKQKQKKKTLWGLRCWSDFCFGQERLFNSLMCLQFAWITAEVENETIPVWSPCLAGLVFRCLPFPLQLRFLFILCFFSFLSVFSSFAPLSWHFPPRSCARVSSFPPSRWPVTTWLSLPRLC